MWAIAQLWVLSAACKHPRFREEKEVRLILAEITNSDSETDASRATVGISSLYHRQSGEQSIPYFKLPFAADAIAEIRLGPKNCARQNPAEVETFLKTNGYDCSQIRIMPSESPYR